MCSTCIVYVCTCIKVHVVICGYTGLYVVIDGGRIIFDLMRSLRSLRRLIQKFVFHIEKLKAENHSLS